MMRLRAPIAIAVGCGGHARAAELRGRQLAQRRNLSIPGQP
jgi:hypothetical protein